MYLISTGLLTLLMLFSAGMYIFNNVAISKVFLSLGYPKYIVIPLAIVKILGLIAIWTKKSKSLLEWAYAGFFFDFVLAASAHINIQDGEFLPSVIAIVLLFASYFTMKKLEILKPQS